MHALLAALLAAAPAVEAPVTEVTVYSDRARVTRTARAAVSGTTVVGLPPLLDSVDPSTIRVLAEGAEVVRVDLRPFRPDSIPPDEARRLLDQLNEVDDKLLRAQAQHAAYEQQSAALAQLAPAVPQGDPLKPPPRLESSGWAAAMAFVAELQARVQERSRALALELDALSRERERLAQQAQLLGGAARRGGYEVVPTLSGSGQATVRLTYVAGPARWYPTYDLQLSPEKGQVQVAFAGLVSQETGEDWSDARVTLSTAVPATATALPELDSWKIGERDRFIPTPIPRPRPLAAPPQAPPLPREVQEADVLRARLYAVAGMAPPREPAGRQARLNEQRGAMGYGAGRGQLGGVGSGAPGMPPPPSAARSAAPSARYDFDSDSVEGELAAPTAESSSARPPRGHAFGSVVATTAATSAFSLAPPAGYVRPQYSPELPASAAGGYDLSWSSLQKETIQSGKGARRVALFAQSWPVEVERKLFPALAPEAYLVAELKSPVKTPLPAGNASLYVGADPAGTARLELVSPGESFTLPLGLDRALKPVRNVELVSAEQGLIGKDDVSKYVVRTELANPYPVAVKVKIFDQWPLTDDEDVEVKLLETRPWAIQDPVKGSLEWHLTLQPRSKNEVSFTYTLRRPKNWRLYQR